ncbi:unnamed protein product, partial [Meganyctiphanes norvegica]
EKSDLHPQENNLIKHLKTGFTGEKPYKCSDCDRGFLSSTDLFRHIRIHTGEKPYKCSQCNHAFAQKYNLTMHLKKVHSETLLMQKEIHCDNQTSSSNEKILLDTNVDVDHSLCHVSTSDFQFPTEVNSSEKSTSNSQENIHIKFPKTGFRNKRHQCSHCDRGFLSSNDLIRHIRIHTGEKPYKCSQCGHAFAQKYNLTTHQKKVHGDHQNS